MLIWRWDLLTGSIKKSSKNGKLTGAFDLLWGRLLPRHSVHCSERIVQTEAPPDQDEEIAVQREGNAVQREGNAVQREGNAVQREGNAEIGVSGQLKMQDSRIKKHNRAVELGAQTSSPLPPPRACPLDLAHLKTVVRGLSEGESLVMNTESMESRVRNSLSLRCRKSTKQLRHSKQAVDKQKLRLHPAIASFDGSSTHLPLILGSTPKAVAREGIAVW